MKTKSNVTKRVKAQPLTAAQRRWRAEEDAAWDAIRGMWAGRKDLEDPVAYQRRIRRDRPLP